MGTEAGDKKVQYTENPTTQGDAILRIDEVIQMVSPFLEKGEIIKRIHTTYPHQAPLNGDQSVEAEKLEIAESIQLSGNKIIIQTVINESTLLAQPEHIFTDENLGMTLLNPPYIFLTEKEKSKFKDTPYLDTINSIEHLAKYNDELLGLAFVLIKLLTPSIFTSSTTPNAAVLNTFVPIITLTNNNALTIDSDMSITLPEHLQGDTYFKRLGISIKSCSTQNDHMRKFSELINNQFKIWLQKRTLYEPMEDPSQLPGIDVIAAIGTKDSAKSSLAKKITKLPPNITISATMPKGATTRKRKSTTQCITTVPQTVTLDRRQHVAHFFNNPHPAIAELLAIIGTQTPLMGTPVSSFFEKIPFPKKAAYFPISTLTVAGAAPKYTIHTMSPASENIASRNFLSMEKIINQQKENKRPRKDMRIPTSQENEKGIFQSLLWRISQLYTSMSASSRLSFVLGMTEQIDPIYASSHQAASISHLKNLKAATINVDDNTINDMQLPPQKISSILQFLALVQKIKILSSDNPNMLDELINKFRANIPESSNNGAKIWYHFPNNTKPEDRLPQNRGNFGRRIKALCSFFIRHKHNHPDYYEKVKLLITSYENAIASM